MSDNINPGRSHNLWPTGLPDYFLPDKGELLIAEAISFTLSQGYIRVNTSLSYSKPDEMYLNLCGDHRIPSLGGNDSSIISGREPRLSSGSPQSRSSNVIEDLDSRDASS